MFDVRFSGLKTNIEKGISNMEKRISNMEKKPLLKKGEAFLVLLNVIFNFA
jgi:hypothetical protein